MEKHIFSLFETCDNMRKFFKMFEDKNINWYIILSSDSMAQRLMLTAKLFIQRVDFLKLSLISNNSEEIVKHSIDIFKLFCNPEMETVWKIMNIFSKQVVETDNYFTEKKDILQRQNNKVLNNGKITKKNYSQSPKIVVNNNNFIIY